MNPLRALATILAAAAILAGCATKPPTASTPPTPAGVTTTGPAASKPKAPLLPRVVATVLGLPGKIFKKKAEPPKAVPAQQIGTIRLVNKEEGFVLIDVTSTQGIAEGMPLVCIMDQKQTATLKISNFRNPPFLIADITTGAPSKDDRVYKP